ncbi:endonuclease MutS2 [candidate division KSB1 bacterium]|nr:endonuclease MutS2 [candidate division KSB1 bacterium]
MNSHFQTLEFDKILDKMSELAASSLGQELVLAIQPLEQKDEIEKSLARTVEVQDLLSYDKPVPMEGILDVRPLFKKLRIENTVLQAEELMALNSILSAARKLRQYFSSRLDKIPVLKKLTRGLIPHPDFEKDMERSIHPQSLEILDSASPELASIRKKISGARNAARKKLEQKQKNLAGRGMLQEDVIAVRNDRLVLVVKDAYKHKVRGLIHDRSASGLSFFIEPLETVEDNNRIREYQAEEKREIQRILTMLSSLARDILPDIEANVSVLAELDAVYARARLAIALNAHPPEITGEKHIHLAQGRHPLLLLRLGEKNVVPLDVSLGSQQHSLIISGPNAGGKTVALKTIGLLSLMARCGLCIPALPHSSIGNIHRFFVAIGDRQSIENDLSTFSSHLLQLNEIAREADERSLVLIDEIGSGTDPEEGTALAMALLRHLSSCLSVVTTHQSALKAFAYQTGGIENASMEFDIDTLTPTYRFRTGIPGSSYAFEIADRTGLPSVLIRDARENVGSSKNKLEGLILELEEKLQRYNDSLQQISIKETELQGLTRLYRDKTENIRSEERRLKKQAAQQAEQILAETNARVENIIREIREKQANREVIRSAKRKLEEQKNAVEKIRMDVDEEPQLPETTHEKPAKGDYVRWTKFGSTGVIESTPDKRGKVMLQTASAKISVPQSELVKIEPPKTKSRVRYNIERPAGKVNEVDLRGMDVETALNAVDQFIDRALLNGLKDIRIVHGKGTGKLRAEIFDYLKKNNQIASLRLGNWNEGDTGVTIAQLK